MQKLREYTLTVQLRKAKMINKYAPEKRQNRSASTLQGNIFSGELCVNMPDVCPVKKCLSLWGKHKLCLKL